LLDSVKKFTGDFKINTKPRRPGDPDSLVADISNTMKYLNWQPQLSSIDKIVATAVNWHKKANKKEIQ
jgi:UDP-glucose 4-epimerase